MIRACPARIWFAHLLFACLIVLSLRAHAQPGDTESAPDILGTWEGFDDLGSLVVIENSAIEGGGFQAHVRTYYGGPETAPTEELMHFTVASHDTAHSQFLLAEDGSTIDARWYGPDGVRLVLPDGTQAVVTRVHHLEASAETWGLPAAPPGFAASPELQSRLTELLGTWQARDMAYGPPDEARVEIEVVDAATGHLRMTLSAPERTETEHLRVVSVAGDTFTVSQTDEVAYFKFVDPETIEISAHGEIVMRMNRPARSDDQSDPASSPD